MNFKTSQILFSEPRMGKYVKACGGDKQKAMQLYRYNLRLCQRFYGVLNLFEVMLRNVVNNHYATFYADGNWIVNQASDGGLFAHEQDDIKTMEADYKKRGIYNNDKMVSALTFGFWTILFSRKRYRMGGKTLLKIFPHKSKGKNQADVYLDLSHIREFRNRIAHHEPICFDASGHISTAFALSHYQLICDYIAYMGQTPLEVISWAERPDAIIEKIESMRSR